MREPSDLEKMGERCLEVVKAHANDKEPELRLIADFIWAIHENRVRLDIRVEPAGTPPAEGETP